MKKVSKRYAAATAYVTSAGTPGRYFLIVHDHEATREFRVLHDVEFPTMRAAWTIANAIRARITGATP